MCRNLPGWQNGCGRRQLAPTAMGRRFFVTIAGTELNRANVASRILKPTAKAAGVPWASFHSCRHTCASMPFEEGWRNVKQVAEWLGHADPAFTLRTYVHLLDDGVGSADFFDSIRSAEEVLTSAVV